MKKHLLALAALATVSGVVAAQNVTVYGAIDSGITNASRSSATGPSQTEFLNGGLSPSIIGFKGSEDLGGGLKANFNLEAHISSKDGSHGTWGGLFGRQANVGVSGGFGTVTLGKQFSPSVLAFAATDPRGLKETYSGLITWLNAGNVVTSTPAAGTVNQNSYSDIFLANAVGFSTSVAGVNLGLAHAVGGTAGNSSANSVDSVGASFSANGVTVSASYTEDKGQAAATTGYSESKRSSVGVGYKFGQFGVKANYMEAKVNSTSANTYAKKNQVTGLGADYAWNASNTLTLAFYNSKNKQATNDDSAKSYILSNDYALSKRTTIYALVASNKGGTNLSSAATMGATYAGVTTTVTQLGINHKF